MSVGPATIADMTTPALPEACLEWCADRSYEYDVMGDLVEVDLDWWNSRLDEARIPVRLHGRAVNGDPVDTGAGFLRRGDLHSVGRGCDLSTVYHCAAWLVGHRHRERARRFPDARDLSEPVHAMRLDRVRRALGECRRAPALIDLGPQREWSGWPAATGFGPVPLSLFAWAVGSEGTLERPQIVDQQALSELVHLGWVENPSVSGITVRRYMRYCDVLYGWADLARVRPELIEMWLVYAWRRRRASPSPFMQEFRDAL
ncbi:hypothetical protein ASG56_03595 [Rhodococcus sp. Leaf7]|nr:hypothetical protein ASG56_03595 [Rhodococcus sp. Leaf7]KQU42244.1 hypothetical protein ASG64_03595 [Rhodococcus sp. Leaf247]